MDFKSHAERLAHFIDQYSPIWREEVMNEYPQTIADYPEEWLIYLANLRDSELFDFDCKRPLLKHAPASLAQFVKEIQELSKIGVGNKTSSIPKLETWAYQGVKAKKRHEIERIMPIIQDFYKKTNFDHAVDIGGGVGHLARVMAHYLGIKTYTIDQNNEFQKIGNERSKKYRKLSNAKELIFIHSAFKDQVADEAQFKSIFIPSAFLLGLHSCGALSNSIIKTSIEKKAIGLLNFGCCYYRMNSENDFPLSVFYKMNSFKRINLFGLSLATRSHAEMKYSTYQTKKRVKYYRYALHLFLLEKFNNKYFTDVGECPIHVYDLPFSHYIGLKLEELKLKNIWSSKEFDDFFESDKIQSALKTMFLCNLIRWQIGRVLEIYILIDRCIYLEENGYNVSLKEYFDEVISPRNLGILALR